MNLFFKLAVRNIIRNKRRSFLAFASLAISLMAIVFFQAMIAGVMQSIIKNSTKNETGHIRIASKDFEKNSRFFPISNNLKNPDTLISLILKDPGIACAIDIIAKRVNFGVLLSNNFSNKSAIALAGELETEKKLLLLQKSILPGGHYLKGSREIIMGIALAKSLNYNLGDTVRVMTSGSDYALHLKKFIAVGFFKTGLNTLDETAFQIKLSDAQNLLGMGTDVQQIIIMLKDYTKADRIASKIRSLLPDSTLAITPWTKIGDLFQTIKMAEKIYVWLYIIVALLGTFIISNIMMMVVLERRKEIGILKSMGLKNGEIQLLFLWEGLILGFVGSLLGAIIAFSIVSFFRIHGLDLSSLVNESTLPMDNIVYPSTNAWNIVAAVILGAVLSAIMSFLPSRQAARLNAVNAIKNI